MQAIILDLDGLIVDSEPVHQRSVNALLARRGVNYRFEDEEYGRCFVGIPVVENIHVLKARFDLRGTPAEIMAERESLYEALLADPANLVLMPGVESFLNAMCARGKLLAVASGSPRNQVEMILCGMNLAHHFQSIVAGNDVPRTKPAPDVYLRAASLLNVAPAECVALEDSATGIAAAKAAGMYAIAIPNQYTAHQDLSQADARAASLCDARKLLD